MKRDLSARELEVLALVAEGRTNDEIAARLYLSRRTVTLYTTRIYAALGGVNRVQAARWYWQREQAK